VLTLLSLFIPVQAANQAQLSALDLGYPLGFLAQNFSRYTPLVFPEYFSLGSPWEDPIVFLNWPSFLVSWAAMSVVVAIIFYGTYQAIGRLRTNWN